MAKKCRGVGQLVKNIFLYRFSRKQVSYLLAATVCLGVVAIAFEYLSATGGRYVYLSFLPPEFKNVLAQIVEIVALLLAGYFVIRFILGFFVDKREKESDELKAIKELSHQISQELPHQIAEEINKINKQKGDD